MGIFRVPGRLTGPTGRAQDVELMVDTGATLLVIPRALANQLELAPVRQHAVMFAGRAREVWPIAEVRLQLNGDEVTTPCFIAPDGPPLLGAVALESLFLAVDPVAKRLAPVEGFAGLTSGSGPQPRPSTSPAGYAWTAANGESRAR